MLHWLPAPTKALLRSRYRGWRSSYVRWRKGFSTQDFVQALAGAGIERGDVVLVHSGMTGFEGFRGTAMEIIAVLKETVGLSGMLIMPTLSMTGSAIEIAESGKVFDPRTTPSKVGLITELFRRTEGVSRSVHPTHSVAAWGTGAAGFVANHHLAATPCGRGTPFHRLLERGGKVLLAGVGIEAMTFYHCAEDLLEDRLPVSPFTRETFVLKCRVNGTILDTAPMRLYDPEVSHRRRLDPLAAELHARGLWREARTGSLTLTALRAADVVVALEAMAGRGVFCYLPA